MTDPASPKPLTIVIAPDSFKGSLTAAEAAAAMAFGVRDVVGTAAHIVLCPMADGGEGTLDAIAAVWGVEPRSLTTVNALRRTCTARYGLSADARTGVIEAAESNGLPLMTDVPSEPQRADTFGVGLLARELLDQNVDEILLCIGGSASTDGGTGLLTALGVRFRGATGEQVAPGGAGLSAITSIDVSQLHPRAREVRWRVAVDVNNPLCGPRGAAAVFGPQKGAQPGDVEALDAGLANLAAVVLGATGEDMRDRPGAGAAGGMPATLVPLLAAEMVPGSILVADAVGLPAALAAADLVLTGEGSFDSQSLGGKVVVAVADLAPEGCPVIVVAGRVALSATETRASRITAAFSIAGGPATLDDLQRQAGERVRETTAQAVALFHRAKPVCGL
ncbi:glycerate kinase [Cryobacterium psychrophilum]|uniref:Glycerate kinase n=1 Tax=Cryobacterium psychrophilum TaxID=41988 RepID=A0A4Y8KRU5_9MICO|nr:glycerate kinase [Cryobacterium psychrophilum]TDW28656.1 glycerate kinase [Cryobacterium psychrophilum]TFD82318.1 glycerate kinase [Cryobacterium psychrophilum]